MNSQEWAGYMLALGVFVIVALVFALGFLLGMVIA